MRRYAEKQGLKPNAFEATNITLAQLRAVAKFQGVDLRTSDQGGDIRIGDLLLIRSGFVKAYRALTAAQRTALANRPFPGGPNSGHRFIGVEQTPAMADWLHNSYFAAVAGDQPAFESWPPQGLISLNASNTFVQPNQGRIANGLTRRKKKGALSLHEQILTYWGVGLGEFFDLERLAARCAQRRKWSFFLTSAPFNVDREILLLSHPTFSRGDVRGL